MEAAFTPESVTMHLSPHDYVFLYLTLTHTLYGTEMSDNDFRNILGMARVDAERSFDRLRDAEQQARRAGQMWTGVVATDVE